MSAEPAGVNDAWQLAEAVAQGPYWVEVRQAVARAEAAEARVAELETALRRLVEAIVDQQAAGHRVSPKVQYARSEARALLSPTPEEGDTERAS